jgi:BolA protein
MKEKIINKLQQLQPSILQIIDNSALHSSHFNGAIETHFKVILSSEKLRKLTRIQAHRIINDLLKDEFMSGLHALEIKLIF